VKLFRLLMGWSQRYTADLVGVSQRQFAKIEALKMRVGPTYRKAIESLCMIAGVRSRYLVEGIAPAIKTGWLYYDVPPVRWEQMHAGAKTVMEYDLRKALQSSFVELMTEHSVREYRIGQLGEEARYYVYAITGEASLVLNVRRDYWEYLDEGAEELGLSLVENVEIPEAERGSFLTPGQDLKDLERVIEIHERLGIGVMAKFWRNIKEITKGVERADEKRKQEMLRKIIIEIMNLGVDPADVWKEWERVKREKEQTEDPGHGHRKKDQTD